MAFPTADAAARECARHLDNQDEREDFLETISDTYEADDVAAWASIVKDWFVGTAHIYCMAFIACSNNEDEIMAEIDSLAETLFEYNNGGR